MQPESYVAHHFPNLRQQEHAARLGMWLFLATEILLFGGLFTAYSVYRFLYPEAFAKGSEHLSVAAGTVNTIVLITSSLTAALAHHLVEKKRGKLAACCLAITVLLALAFLGIKAWEWTHDFREGFFPGRFYDSSEFTLTGAPMFFTMYFLLTGLHGLHVLVGMTVLGTLGVLSWRGKYDHGYVTPVELGAMYWHLVDLIWIFLYPLLYLI
ncbi:MAG TPA: cytochrome c oxidase subunit 3 family protein [Anaeromyxobacteraceae bacterium]|nr:cytochrome c oxidase subunit 3 family protein [Anaeromyxobacteraceae bacterium]